MTKILAMISLLSTPFVIYLAFGWQGVAAAFVAIMVYAVLDIRRTDREYQWQNSPINNALRMFGQYNFSLENEFGKRGGGDVNAILPDHFSEKKREEIRQVYTAYGQLLGKIQTAVNEFECSLKIKNGTGASSEEILIIADCIKQAIHNVKMQFSPEYAELQSRISFFENLIGELDLGRDPRGDNIWGEPQKILGGKRFYMKEKALDILYLDSGSPEKFWIAVGPDKLDIAEFCPDRLPDCVARIEALSK